MDAMKSFCSRLAVALAMATASGVGVSAYDFMVAGLAYNITGANAVEVTNIRPDTKLSSGQSVKY